MLKTVVLPTVILVNCFVISVVGQCNDYENEGLLENSSVSEEADVTAIAEVEQYDAANYNYTDYIEIEERSGVPAVTAAPKTEPTVKTNTSKTATKSTANKVTKETFTVYDLNTGRRVTLNGYDMVCQIVRNEVGAHYTSGSKAGQTAYDEEAIKAFAVAAYTYVKYNVERGQTPRVGLNTDVSQTLKNYVAKVYGQAIYYDNDYICAVYCASTGGTTTSSANGWGKANPYLVSVVSKYDSQGKQFKSTRTFTAQQMKSIIEGRTNIALSDNPSNWLKVTSVVDGGYVSGVSIDGHSTCSVGGGERTITGAFFRTYILGTSNMKSTHFTVSYGNGVFTITSYGYGHGVGMPAEGAQLYAVNANWSYAQILKHYYTGVVIK